MELFGKTRIVCFDTSYVQQPAYLKFQLFGPINDTLHGRRFHIGEALKAVVHSLLWHQLSVFGATGVKNLVGQWYKYVLVDWSNME